MDSLPKLLVQGTLGKGDYEKMQTSYPPLVEKLDEVLEKTYELERELEKAEKNRENIAGVAAHEINRKGLARSFQVTNIFHRMSVLDNLRCGALWSLGHRYAFWKLVGGLPDVAERCDGILEQIGLAAKREWPAGMLSYADQRALELGITIVGGADVILLDEPTAGMSHSETAAAVALIRRISEGKTLVVVEHDMGVVFDLADRISVLVYGKIIASGPPAEIRASAEVREAYLGTEAS
ncbi:MAG: ATP-binding cassette domain-containing protein [Candidatus Krumholzibacteriota bacterium]|nr:ATP-binding cassette domain-containing protein [Candidatus Krumholzibacteriota bacterium]